jgi:hypothetical protein
MWWKFLFKFAMLSKEGRKQKEEKEEVEQNGIT